MQKRIAAAVADHDAGSDLAWVRADKAGFVRSVAAEADSDAGRDLAWARADKSMWVRGVAGEGSYYISMDIKALT